MRPRRFRWHTDDMPPSVGDYLVSKGLRARAAYLILEVKESRAAADPGCRVWILTVERAPRDDIPAEAPVHPFTWLPRQSRR